MNYFTVYYFLFWAAIALAEPVLPELPDYPEWFQVLLGAIAGMLMQLSRMDIEGKGFKLGYLGMAAGASAGMVSLLVWQGVSSPYLALPVAVVVGWIGVKGMELLEGSLPLSGKAGAAKQPSDDAKKGVEGDNDRG
jgi:hypothetical protein